MKVEFMEITPKMSEIWLSTSNGNPRWKTGKTVDRFKVEKIENDIRNVKWNPANNSIAFDENNCLVDGHHRLTAIKNSGISVKSLVVFGISNSGLQHIDENDTRRVHQRIGVDSQIVSAANYHFWLLGERNRAKTSEVVSEWIAQHPLIYTARDICIKGAKHAIAKKSFVVHGTMCALECGVEADRLYQFMSAVNSGFSTSAFESPAIVLRNMLLKSYRAERGTGILLDYATQAAIHDYIDGVQRKRAYTEKSGVYFDYLVREKKPGYENCEFVR